MPLWGLSSRVWGPRPIFGLSRVSEAHLRIIWRVRGPFWDIQECWRHIWSLSRVVGEFNLILGEIIEDKNVFVVDVPMISNRLVYF